MKSKKLRNATAKAVSIDTNAIILSGVSVLVLVVLVIEAVRLGL